MDLFFFESVLNIIVKSECVHTLMATFLYFVALAVSVARAEEVEIKADSVLENVREGIKGRAENLREKIKGGAQSVLERLVNKIKGDGDHEDDKDHVEREFAERIVRECMNNPIYWMYRLVSMRHVVFHSAAFSLGTQHCTTIQMYLQLVWQGALLGKEAKTLMDKFLESRTGMKKYRESLRAIKALLAEVDCSETFGKKKKPEDNTILQKITSVIQQANKAIELISNRIHPDDDEIHTINTLAAFDAKLDLALDFPAKLRESKLIRHRALTTQNMSKYDTDFSDIIDKAYNLHHDFFPGIETRSYDPTILNDGDQMPGINNHDLQCLFSLPPNVLHQLARAFFSITLIPMAQTGRWENDIPGFSHFSGKSNRDHHIATDLDGRWQWKMENFFDKTFNTDEANQDISKRNLYNWPSQNEPFTDEMFSKFYFAGIGQSFVRQVDEKNDHMAKGAMYMVDLDFLSALPTQQNVGKYGGDIFFDGNGKLMYIIYEGVLHNPPSADSDCGCREEEWEDVKRRCRGTLLLALTAIDHFLVVHMHFSNSLAMAVPLLPNDHKMRQFLWPHIFNAINVNRVATLSLSIDGGLFSRGWGLTHDSTEAVYEFAKQNIPTLKWHTPDQIPGLRGIPASLKMPLYEDGLDYFAICKKYVERYVKLNYANDEAVRKDAALGEFHANLNKHTLNNDLPAFNSIDTVVKAIATYIYYVTGYHTYAGTVHNECVQSGVAPSKWYEDGTFDRGSSPPNPALWAAFTCIGTASLTLPITGDTCSTEQTCGFADKTSYQNPLPSDAVFHKDIKPVGYPELFDTKEAKEINKLFVVELLELQKTIIQRNKERHSCTGDRVDAVCRPFNAFDANYIEMSVGI